MSLFELFGKPRDDIFARKSEFERAVAKSKGKVVVVVHPFYDSHDPRDWKKSFPAEYFDRVNALMKQSKAPVIMFEERDRVHSTRGMLGAQNVFFLRTKIADSTPVAGWKRVHKLLQAAGARTILIAGSHALHKNPTPHLIDDKLIRLYEMTLGRNRRAPIVGGCVAGAYEQMIRQGYEKVRLVPHAVYPDKPKA